MEYNRRVKTLMCNAVWDPREQHKDGGLDLREKCEFQLQSLKATTFAGRWLSFLAIGLIGTGKTHWLCEATEAWKSTIHPVVSSDGHQWLKEESKQIKAKGSPDKTSISDKPIPFLFRTGVGGEPLTLNILDYSGEVGLSRLKAPQYPLAAPHKNRMQHLDGIMFFVDLKKDPGLQFEAFLLLCESLPPAMHAVSPCAVVASRLDLLDEEMTRPFRAADSSPELKIERPQKSTIRKNSVNLEELVRKKMGDQYVDRIRDRFRVEFFPVVGKKTAAISSQIPMRADHPLYYLLWANGYSLYE